MSRHNEILSFISHFAGSEDTFLYGCCYWFAFILRSRFGLDIVYEPVEGHFLARAFLPSEIRDGVVSYSECFFDIRGDVTAMYSGKETYKESWLKKNEPNWYARIMNDCRYFIAPTDEELEVS